MACLLPSRTSRGALAAVVLLLGLAGCDTSSGNADQPGPPTSGDGDGDGGDGDGVGDGDDSGFGGDGSSGDGDGDGDNAVAGGPSDAPPGYPEGPYGEGNPAVGDVIENLSFIGFARIGDGVLVNSEEYESFSLADLRDEGAEYALIHTATTWCPSCRTAADDLAARGDELSGQGALLVELVLENNSYLPPSETDLSLWVTGSDLTITTVGPADDRTKVVFPSREYVYIVELETMEVVWAHQALFTDPSITELGIEALLERLGS